MFLLCGSFKPKAGIAPKLLYQAISDVPSARGRPAARCTGQVRAMDRLRSDALARQSDELRRTLRERVGPVSPPSLAAFFMFWLCEEDIDPEPEVGLVSDLSPV